MKMSRPTNDTITSMTAASGSSTQPSRSAVPLTCGSPNWNQKKLTTCLRGRAVAGMLKRVDERHARQHQREDHRANGQRRREPALALLEQRAQPRRQERQRGNQPELVEQSNPSQPFIESI